MTCLANNRHRLLHRIHRRYQATQQIVDLKGLKFPFVRVTDPDVVLDQVAAEVDLHERLHGREASGQMMHLPYWAELWDSAMGIALHLADNASRFDLRKRSVLDLGCGMGLSGAAAAALGARVLFADLESPALLFARLNSLPWRHRVRTRQLNWQRDRLNERFDLIVGADILYEKTQWPYLELFWRAHLKENGSVLLGEPGRSTGDMFQEWIGNRGWLLERLEQPVSTREKPIRLFALTLAPIAIDNEKSRGKTAILPAAAART
ncbi:MAG TPA: 50S ribosomal protein L11 methyltransferase [Tepidisphaeraceae bacterium]|nr:50S ribosomal protein L11 methyltransferase [Tepidisphaeraceae bacterium]